MEHVKDIDQSDFGAAVLQRSNEVTVVVDFWASWCGPCKVLGPLLEKAAADYEGRFELAKVDVDANTELAARFGVQSIPTVIAFQGGEPVGRFTGAIPDASIRKWIDSLLPTEEDAIVERARDLAIEGDEAGAEALLRQVLDTRSDHVEAVTALASLLIARGEAEEALIVLGRVPRTGEVERLEAAARTSSGKNADLPALQAAVAADPSDASARIALGRALAAHGEFEPALDQMLEAVRSGGPLRDEARQAMVDVFGLIGPEHPLAATYRRLLANELF